MSIAKIEQVIHNVWKRVQNSKLIIFDTLVAFGLAFFTLNVNRSRFLGHDFNWDLLNYHLSNVTLKQHLALHPSGIQNYLPSTLDQLILPIHTLIPSPFVGLLMLVPYVLDYFILRNLFIRKILEEQIYMPKTLVIVSLSSSTALSQMNNSMGDMLVSPFVLFGLGLALLGIKKHNARFIVLSALPLGIAMGLKSTHIYVLFSLFIILFYFVVTKKVTISTLFKWSFVNLFVFFAISFRQNLFLLKETGNPVFPFMNALFRSPSYPEVNFRDDRFGLHNFSDFLITPIRLARGNPAGTSELKFQDPRLLLMLFSLVLLLTLALIKSLRSKEKELANIYCLGIFIFLAYISWGYLFGISRYFLSIEMLIPLFACGVILHLGLSNHNRKLSGIFIVLVIALITTNKTTSVNWGYDGDRTSDIAFEKAIYPLKLDNYSAILLADQPLAFISYQIKSPTDTIYFSPAFNSHNLEEQLKIISVRTVYTLSYNADTSFLNSQLNQYNRQTIASCKTIDLDFKNSLTPSVVYLCETKPL